MKAFVFPLLLIISSACFSQSKEFLYYFDKDLNMADEAHAVFYGTGAYENGLLKLMLYNNKDRHLIMIEHFTDSTLRVTDGLFSSFNAKGNKESEGNFTNGKRDGDWVTWDENGHVLDSSFYENDRLKNSKRFFGYSRDKPMQVIQLDMEHRKFHCTYYTSNNMITEDTASANVLDKVFTKVETEPTFPGGDAAWSDYVKQLIKQHKDEADAEHGSCKVRFIVDLFGDVSEVTSVLCDNSWLANITTNAIRKGQKWIPGQQNGRYVSAYKFVTVAYTQKDD